MNAAQPNEKLLVGQLHVVGTTQRFGLSRGRVGVVMNAISEPLLHVRTDVIILR